MKAPVGLSSRQSGLRSKCRVFSAARTGIHEKGAARPFQTPKGKSKRKKASRFAKTGCGSQRLLRCRSHPAGRCPNSSSLFPPLAAVVAVALFSRFSDLLLRSWCYLSADGKVLRKPEIFGEAVKRRRAKMRLRDLHAEWRESPAFLLGAHLSGVTRGEQPLVRASRASKVAGTFLVLFWCAKENLTPRKSALTPRTGARCRQSVTTIISAFSSME